MGILLVKLGYTADEVSSIEWVLFLVYACSFFWTNGLRSALSSYWDSISQEERGVLIHNIFYFFFVTALLIGLAFYVFYRDVHWIWLLLYLIFSIPAMLSEHTLLLRDRAKYLSSYALVIHGLYVVLTLVAAWTYRSVEAVLVALVIWAVIKFIWTWFIVKKNGEWFPYSRSLWPFLMFGMPLAIMSLLGSGMDVVDGFLVRNYFDEDLFARYRYGAKELPIISLLINSLVMGSIALATASMDETILKVKRQVSRYMDWMFPLSGILIVIAPVLYTYFYSAEYLLSADIFRIYLLIIVTRILTPQLLLYALKENKMLLWSSFFELLLNLGLSLLFMRMYGVIGIVYATLLAYVFEKVVLVSYLKYVKGISIGRYVDVSKYVIYSTLLITVYIASLWF